MTEADRDKMLREMATNRGCRLVKSRRRTPGVGDYGHYGLTAASSGAEVFGFGENGLTATPDEIEAFLRKGLVADWKSSLAVAEQAPATAKPKSARSTAPDTPRSGASARGPTRGRAQPPPKAPPKLRIVESPTPSPPPIRPPPPPPASPPPPPPPSRPILKIRDARPGDAAGIGNLLEPDVGPETIAARISAQRKAGEPPLVADEDGSIVGCLAWHSIPLLQRDAPLGRISLLVVAPRARRRGIGRALVEEAEARLIDAGCTRTEAMAEIDLGAAPDFFRRLGWSRAAYRYAREFES